MFMLQVLPAWHMHSMRGKLQELSLATSNTKRPKGMDAT
jgi:hypothetical protein